MTQVFRSCSITNACASVTNANIPNLPAGISVKLTCNECNTDNCNSVRSFPSSGSNLVYSKLLFTLPIILFYFI